jgi:Alkylmercury lyase
MAWPPQLYYRGALAAATEQLVGETLMHRFYTPYGQYGETSANQFEFTDVAKRVRKFLYDYFLTNGTSPELVTIRERLGLSQEQTWEGLHELERANFVVFVPGTEDILKVPPFSAIPNRFRVTAEDGRRWYAGCAGESTTLNAFLPGLTVTVNSTCPTCWGPITLEIRDRKLLAIQGEDAVIHIGTHPDHFRENWIVACDSINFFCSAAHVAEWEQAVPERKGAHFPIQNAMKWTNQVAPMRLDYDRPSNQYTPGVWRNSYVALGADISAWD